MRNRQENEIKTVRMMIEMFCRHHHHERLCKDCGALLEYAEKKVQICPHGVDKPVCSHCEVHCYKPDMRSRIREVMRFGGPRMIYKHPILTLKHMMNKS
jgi:hypothetical protein